MGRKTENLSKKIVEEVRKQNIKNRKVERPTQLEKKFGVVGTLYNAIDLAVKNEELIRYQNKHGNGPGQTYLVVPGYEKLIELEITKSQVFKDFKDKIPIFNKLDLTELIKNWINIIPDAQVGPLYGLHNAKYEYGRKINEMNYNSIGSDWLEIKYNGLFEFLKERIEYILSTEPEFCCNPIIEQEQFIKNIKEFYKKRIKLISKICIKIINVCKLEKFAYDFIGKTIDIPEILPLGIIQLLINKEKANDENYILNWLNKPQPAISPKYKGGKLHKFCFSHFILHCQFNSNGYEVNFSLISLNRIPNLKLDYVNLIPTINPEDEKISIWDVMDKNEKAILTEINKSKGIKSLLSHLINLSEDLNKNLSNIRTALRRIIAYIP